MNKIFLIVLFIVLNTTYVFCDDNLKNVSIKIETHENTIINTTLKANTFLEAIEKLIKDNKDNKLEILFLNNNGFNQIFSINDLQNNTFKQNDSWLTYIKRGSQIIPVKNMKNSMLQNNDELIIFYGNPDLTYVITDLDIKNDKDNITSILFKSELIDKKIITTNKQPLKVYIENIDKTETKFLITDIHGVALTRLSNFGIYNIIINNYSKDKLSNVISYGPYYLLNGLKNYEKVSRAEAVSFFVNYFKISKKNNVSFNFRDLNTSHLYYDDIYTAYSNKLIFGYTDNVFKPDDAITLLQFSILLANFFPSANNHVIANKNLGVPDWALQKIDFLIQNNLLQNIDLDFDGYVSQSIVSNIYKNLSNFNKY